MTQACDYCGREWVDGDGPACQGCGAASRAVQAVDQPLVDEPAVDAPRGGMVGPSWAYCATIYCPGPRPAFKVLFWFVCVGCGFTVPLLWGFPAGFGFEYVAFNSSIGVTVGVPFLVDLHAGRKDECWLLAQNPKATHYL